MTRSLRRQHSGEVKARAALEAEEVYLKDYENVGETTQSIGDFFEYYNEERRHQSLDDRTPAEVYKAG